VVTFESRLQPNIHVIAMPRSPAPCLNRPSPANAQAKVCAAAVATLLHRESPSPPKLINTCYSLVAPDYGISIAGVYRPGGRVRRCRGGAGGSVRFDAPADFRALEPLMRKPGFARSRQILSADAVVAGFATTVGVDRRRRARGIAPPTGSSATRSPPRLPGPPVTRSAAGRS